MCAQEASERAVWVGGRKIAICLSREEKLITRRNPSIITQLGLVALYTSLPDKDIPVNPLPVFGGGGSSLLTISSLAILLPASH